MYHQVFFPAIIKISNIPEIIIFRSSALEEREFYVKRAHDNIVNIFTSNFLMYVIKLNSGSELVLLLSYDTSRSFEGNSSIPL